MKRSVNGWRRGRRGYAMMLVFVFLILLMTLLGTTFRQMATTLRIEAARSRQVLRDEGSLRAAAKGVAMLESGPPPSDPYRVTITVDTSAGPRAFSILFASDVTGPDRWVVEVDPAPGS